MRGRNNLIKLLKSVFVGNLSNKDGKSKKSIESKYGAIDEEHVIIDGSDTTFEEEIFEIRDKYSEFDMTVFNKEAGIYNYKNMRSSNIANKILIESIEDKNYTIELVNLLLAMIKEKIEMFNLNKIASDSLVFEDENGMGRTSLSFTPFTKTGKVKKFPYELSFQTEEVIKRRYHDFEHMTSDGAPFGRMSLDNDLKIGKASIHIWSNDTRNSYSFKIVEDGLIINKIVKISLQDSCDGKPETEIYKI